MEENLRNVIPMKDVFIRKSLRPLAAEYSIEQLNLKTLNKVKFRFYKNGSFTEWFALDMVGDWEQAIQRALREIIEESLPIKRSSFIDSPEYKAISKYIDN